MKRRRPRASSTQLPLGLDVDAGLLAPRVGAAPQPTFTELLDSCAPAAPTPLEPWDGYPGEFLHGSVPPWQVTACGLPVGGEVALFSQREGITCPACSASPPRPFRRVHETCETSGCTDDNPCRDAAGKVACSWMRRNDPRCSLCIVAAERPQHDPADPWGLAPPGVDVDELSTVQHPTAYDLRTAAPWEG